VLARLDAWEAAGVPTHFQGMRFGTYPAGPETTAAVAGCRAWLTEARRPGLLLHGAFGVGKTGLAVSVLWEALEAEGLPGRFMAVPDLLDAIRASYRSEGPSPLDALKTAPLLVLDDLGAERVTDWVAERLFVLVNARHGNPAVRTVFTSNLPPSKLGAHLGERIAWRIIEMCQVVKVDGGNLRDRGAA
jgi:DNA replication protein DnaC